jgi:hypothetical protein
MKKIFVYVALLIPLISFFLSCTKKSSCNAGTGGSLTIVAYPQHHGKPIYSHGNYRDTIFVKFNASDFPGTSPSSYDAHFIGDSGTNFVNLNGLQCGNYYIYGVALDSSGPYRVTGGIPYSTTQTSGTLNLDVPVTE